VSRRAAVAAAAAASLLAAAGCSSGPSQEEYVAEVNELCGEARVELREIPDPTTPQEIPATLQEGTRVLRELVDDIGAVEQPPDDAERIESEFLAPFREGVGEAESLLPQIEQTAAAGDTDRLTEILRRYQDAGRGERIDAFLVNYGLQECSAIGT
jgi:hypothetical protein